MEVGQKVEEALQAINPHKQNKLLWKLLKPSEQKISTYVDFLNLYIKERFTESNLTEFTYEILLRLFAWEALIKKELEKGVNLALPYVADGNVVFDIGANMGQFSLYLLKKRAVSVTLFEPVPLYRDYCRLATANIPSATVVGKALSDEEGTARFFIDHANLGWNTLVEEKQTTGMQEITVETTTLDTYMGGSDKTRVDLMKIDVEGAEYRVLTGAHETLSSLDQKPVIMLEIGWGTNHPYRERETKEFEWLINNGYQRFEYEYEGTTDVLILPLNQASK